MVAVRKNAKAGTWARDKVSAVALKIAEVI